LGDSAESDAPTSHGLGAMVTRLLAEHWPGSGVNGYYLADLLREEGVRVIPPVKPCACGHPSVDHDTAGHCMHLCDCAWP
jgi:hypothetical protein